VVVASVGNSPEADTIQYPARYPAVVSVCATDKSGGHAPYSVRGPEVLVCAPGERTSTAYPGDKYAISSGTSNAAAIVSGVVALIRSTHPAFDASEVVTRLTNTCVDKGQIGRDDTFGYGIVSPIAAIDQSTSVVSSEHETTPTEGPARKGSFSAALTLAILILVALALAVGCIAIIAVRRRRRSTRLR
jgi:subtilisin family serine protease